MFLDQYKNYVDYLSRLGFKKSKASFTDSDTSIVTKSESSEIYKLVCPQSHKLILPPVDNLDMLIDYGFNIKLIDRNGKEISGDTQINIRKVTVSGCYITISDIMYYNIRIGGSAMYNPMIGIELNEHDKLVFRLVDYDIKNINVKDCKLYAKIDIFAK